MPCRSFCLLVALSLGSIVAAVSAGPAEPVRLVDEPGAWRLSNGLVELTVDKKLAKLVHLAPCGGPELLAEGGYYDTNASPGGADRSGYLRFGHHVPVVAAVATQTDELVDLVMTTDASRAAPQHHPLRCEFHYVLRRGDPGVYAYWVLWHEPDMPTCHLGQTRYVLKCSREVFDRWQITDDRSGTFPSPDERAAAERAYDATIRLPDGRYMTKYANAVAAADHHLSGLYSSEHKLGLWQINPSSEYINGGPTKQNLTIHGEDPIILHMVQSGHFGGGSIDIEGEWAKVFGPIFYYVNQGASEEQLWRDAQARVRDEQSRWPYQWVKPRSVPDAYPLRRGTVRGRVARTDGGPAEGTTVLLGAPGPEWQQQGLGYMFWAPVRQDGSFGIPKVRPGTYTLYAFQPGLFGEARRDGAEVRADETADLGLVPLAAETRGRLLWQIGVPDRTAREYRHGGEFRQVYLHQLYGEDFPEDVRFVIGQSQEAQDWNYYQPGGRTWRVLFRLEQPPRGNGILTIAVADSGYRPPTTIVLAVNGEQAASEALEPGDSALWRLGIYGRYQVHLVELPGRLFRVGENELSLQLPDSRAWLMYDFLRLEDTGGQSPGG